VFITHGGLLGTQEAVHAGVHMVGIPQFADRELNIMNYASRGVAVMVHYENITKQSIFGAVKTVLDDPR
jgi:glucuronosyltransferase